MGFSQLNHSFIEANKTWDEFFVTDVSAYGKQYYIDSIYQANGYKYGTIKSYVLVNQNPNDNSIWPPIFVLNSAQTQVEMYLREDLSSGKLYGSTPGSNETLLHDYTLGIGDSMLVDGIYHYVTNLSTTTIQNNQQRYTIVFDSLYSLIDGIGSTNKFLSAVNLSGPFSSYILACAQQNNSPLYGSYCSSTLSSYQSTQARHPIRLFPNPCRREIHLESDAQHQKLEIYTASGQFVETFDLNGKPTSLDVSALKEGLYFYKIDQQYTGTFVRMK